MQFRRQLVRLYLIRNGIGVVANHIRGVLIAVAGFQKAQYQAFVDVIFTPLARVYGAVIEALVGDLLCFVDVESAKAADQNDWQLTACRLRPCVLRHAYLAVERIGQPQASRRDVLLACRAKCEGSFFWASAGWRSRTFLILCRDLARSS